MADKRRLLETIDVTQRLELSLEMQRERLAELQVRKRIRDDVESGAQKQQRDYFLRKRMESIRKELGDDDASIVEEYERKIAEAEMPEAVQEQAVRELRRLERMGEQSGEHPMIRTYLDTLLSVPWSKRSEERLDPAVTRQVLDADHAGLEDVKRRIVEYIAVRKLREERDVKDDKRSGAILTLVGPPGTGKTSIGESIARALGREFVRMSLGGVRDEAEIRGHRRTYIGAMPGPAGRGAARCRDHEPGDPAGRGGQGWGGIGVGVLRRPARGPGPGPEPFVPRPLPWTCELRSLERSLFIATANIRQTHPGTASRPHGGDRIRRLHHRGEGRIARGVSLWPSSLRRNGFDGDG